ncbi:MAG: hypothetical protein GY894_02165, partial [Planctomycetes bacterium]|nr:hypothetical protein [Planctomycetota bacterium]
MPLSQVEYRRRHAIWQKLVDVGEAEEPQWSVGDTASRDVRQSWQRTYAMMESITPPFHWNRLTSQQKLHLAVAVNQMREGSMVKMPAVSERHRAELFSSGYVVRWHGTYVSCLDRIYTIGLAPSFGGAGAGERKRKYEDDEDIPQVFVAWNKICAIRYPQLMWEGNAMLGEIVATDGTKPLRAILECACIPTDRTWQRKDGDNSQVSYAYGSVVVLSVELHSVAKTPADQRLRTEGLPTMKEI